MPASITALTVPSPPTLPWSAGSSTASGRCSAPAATIWSRSRWTHLSSASKAIVTICGWRGVTWGGIRKIRQTRCSVQHPCHHISMSCCVIKSRFPCATCGATSESYSYLLLLRRMKKQCNPTKAKSFKERNPDLDLDEIQQNPNVPDDVKAMLKESVLTLDTGDLATDEADFPNEDAMSLQSPANLKTKQELLEYIDDGTGVWAGRCPSKRSSSPFPSLTIICFLSRICSLSSPFCLLTEDDDEEEDFKRRKQKRRYDADYDDDWLASKRKTNSRNNRGRSPRTKDDRSISPASSTSSTSRGARRGKASGTPRKTPARRKKDPITTSPAVSSAATAVKTPTSAVVAGTTSIATTTTPPADGGGGESSSLGSHCTTASP